ncbi:gp22 prohead core scaffold protein [Klebsiella phage 05F01]|nr:gp22 prohead core scaffold protein [Klebsiella phage 05F01]
MVFTLRQKQKRTVRPFIYINSIKNRSTFLFQHVNV